MDTVLDFLPNSYSLSYAGLMLRNGYWLNLETHEWESRRFPPKTDLTLASNTLFTFQGMPTFFGGTACTDDGICEYKEVQQYDAGRDLWITLGNMRESRSYHEVN